jgi:hypothetical protein
MCTFEKMERVYQLGNITCQIVIPGSPARVAGRSIHNAAPVGSSMMVSNGSFWPIFKAYIDTPSGGRSITYEYEEYANGHPTRYVVIQALRYTLTICFVST